MHRLSDDELTALRAREQCLLWPGPDVTAEDLEKLLDDDFHEIGASGKRLSRQFGLDTLSSAGSPDKRKSG